MLLPKHTRKEAVSRAREHALVIGLIALFVISGSLLYGWMLKAVFNYLAKSVFDLF